MEPIDVANWVASALLAKRRRRRSLARVGEVAGAVGRGLLAGAAGTAAMMASSAIETKARGRPASAAPVQAVERVFGVKSADERSRRRLSTAVHWLYGILTMRSTSLLMEAKALGGYAVHVRFEDGTAADVDLSYLLDYRGVFEPLRDQSYFARLDADREAGTIVWPTAQT